MLQIVGKRQKRGLFRPFRVYSWIVLAVAYQTIYEITETARNTDLVWLLNCQLNQSSLKHVGHSAADLMMKLRYQCV